MLPRLSPAIDHRSLFLSRYDRLLSRARTLLGSRVDLAPDLVHEAFVQFVSRQPALDAIDDVDAYLHGMVRYLHLSRVRRAGRFPMLPIADFDSVLLAGLHGSDGSARIEALHELAHLCRYASVRKDSSPAASVLILRGFWGFSPSAVAKLAHAAPDVVAQRLRRARIEARTYLSTPRRLAFMRQRPQHMPVREDRDLPPLIAFDPAAPIHDICAHALMAIVRTRRGPCVPMAAVEAMYAGEESVPIGTLAHFASCPICLDRAIQHLRIDQEDGLRVRVRAPRTKGRLLWQLALVLLVGWLAFGGGVSTLAAAAGRVWDWVSHAASHLASANAGAGGGVIGAPNTLASKPLAVGPMRLVEATPSAAVSFSSASLIDVEVRALQLLDGVDALRGEQVAFARTRDRLLVSIVVDDGARARQVQAALASIADDRRVVLRVDAVQDLVARATTPRAIRSGAVRQYSLGDDSNAMQDDMQAYFARTTPGGQDASGLTDAEHDLARRLTAASHRALRQTWALRRLVDAFSASDLSTMSASASMTWRGLIATHVRGYRRELDELTNALTAVVPTPADGAIDHEPPLPASDPRAAAGIEQSQREPLAREPVALHASLRALLLRAVEVDDAVQRSFRSRAVSPPEGEASVSASALVTVKTASFWRTLAEARRLAAALDSQ